MSGKIVGEVMNSAYKLKAHGIKQPAYLALLAIAEKADHYTREASVPLCWIQQGMYGVCPNTARTALRQLEAAKLIEVVEPGRGNRYGGRAPIYRVAGGAVEVPTATGTSNPWGGEF